MKGAPEDPAGDTGTPAPGVPATFSICPKCGAKMPASRSVDLCPVCQLRAALDPASLSDMPTSEDSDVFAAPDRQANALSIRRFDHYELLTLHDGTPIELGRGAMGITYKALDTNLHCPVALKVINARYLENKLARLRFVREARRTTGR